jgi:hypothetical protein
MKLPDWISVPLALAAIIGLLAVMLWLTRVYVLYVSGQDGGTYGWLF